MRLSVVFGREDAGVDENEDDDKPVEPLRLDRLTTDFTTTPSPLYSTPSEHTHQPSVPCRTGNMHLGFLRGEGRVNSGFRYC